MKQLNLCPENGEKTPKMTMVSPSPQEKQNALREVLESATFFRADQLRKFLGYVCQMEFSGREDELCESLIGIEAFGRPAGYSPSEDASVRRRARDLRDKLQEVYAKELAGSRVRIELPKGKFVPRFVRVALDDAVNAGPDALLTTRPAATEAASLEHLRNRLADGMPVERPETNGIPGQLDRYGRRTRRLITFWFAAGCAVGALTVSVVFWLLFWPLPHSQHSAVMPPAAVVVDPSPPPAPTPHETGTTYEAEASGNTMSGNVQAYACNRCSGGARVRNIGHSRRNYLIVNNIVVAKDANYQMAVCYLLQGDRSFFIQVNDGTPIELRLSGESWLKVARTSLTVPLKAGANRVKFYNDHGYAPDLDRIMIR